MTFLNEGTFTLASSVEDVLVIFKCRVSARYWLIYTSMNFVIANLTFKTNIKM